MIGRTPFATHIADHVQASLALLPVEERIDRWAQALVDLFDGGGRLLVGGNGGSAAEAQHLTGELVGRYQSERRPMPAIALHADTSTLTAIANDYGWEEVYARALSGLSRPGDQLLLLSTSGRSANLLRAVDAAHEASVGVWAVTGPAPNPLERGTDDAIAVPGAPPVVQEAHLLVVHLLCDAIDTKLAAARSRRGGLVATTPSRTNGTHAGTIASAPDTEQR